MKNDFIAALHAKKKVLLTFYSKEDNCNLIRTCAPMDYGPSSRAHDKSDRFHFWDYDSDKQRHTLSLLPEQVVSIQVLNEIFNPAEFVTWTTSWHVRRDWGQYS